MLPSLSLSFAVVLKNHYFFNTLDILSFQGKWWLWRKARRVFSCAHPFLPGYRPATHSKTFEYNKRQWKKITKRQRNQSPK